MPEDPEGKKGWLARRIERLRKPSSHLVKVGQDKDPIPEITEGPRAAALAPHAMDSHAPPPSASPPSSPVATASTTPPRLDIVDLNNPDYWKVPRGDGMEKGVNAEREQELDGVDDDPDDEEDEDDDEEDDEEDDEDDEDEPKRPPLPNRRPPVPRALSREDLKTIIMEKFAQGLTSYEIQKWFIKENIIDQETGEVLSIRQIGGFKSILSTMEANARSSAGAAAAAPATEEKGKVLIPRPRTKLDTFVDMLEKATTTDNLGLAQIAVDGIYKEMERGEGGGMSDKVWELLKAQLESGKGKSKLTELKELTDIVKNLMPDQPEGKTEAVQMAEVMERSVHDTVMEVKDTALRVSGSKNQADKMGKCPSCAKIIPMDSLYCNYCGLAFKQKIEEEGGEEEEDEEEAKERQRAEEEKKRRADIARRAIGGRKSQPQRPPPAQLTPQPAKPAAQAPTPVAPTPVAPTPVQTPQPAAQPVTPAERAAILHNLKRLANFIAAKDDPILKTQVLFKLGDNDDRKNGLFLAIVGRERLLAAGQRLIKEHPELADFQHYVELCDSADGRLWIDTSFEEVKRQSKLGGIMLKKEEAAEFLDKVEARLGFPIE